MKRNFVSVFSCAAVFLLIMALQTSFAADKSVVFTSVQEGGVISIYPNSFPVERVIKGKVKGFSKEEIVKFGLTVDVFILDVLHGPVPVTKKGKWEAKVMINTADLVIKAVVKDKDGNEMASSTIKATASGEF